MSEKRKIVLVGTGFVGMSMAYSFLSTGGIDELVLLDVAKEKAVGEAMDLQHGLPYARGKMEILCGLQRCEYCGDYSRSCPEAGGNTSGPDSEERKNYEERCGKHHGKRL